MVLNFRIPMKLKKKPYIIETVEKHYKIMIRVYQYLFTEVADIFLGYIYSLDSNEIQQFYDGIMGGDL